MNAAIVKDDAQLAQREHFVRTTHAQLGEVYVEGVGFRFSDMQRARRQDSRASAAIRIG